VRSRQPAKPAQDTSSAEEPARPAIPVPALAASRMGVRPATGRPRATTRLTNPRRTVDQPPTPTAADWAVAAGVATAGATFGVLAAWLVGDRGRAS
jgi:hypothetical protein